MNASPESFRWRKYVVYFGFFLLIMSACDGGGCGGCDGFSDAPYPESDYDKTVAGGAEVRLTTHGLDFVSGEVENLVGLFMEDGLSFCVPPTEGDFDICHEDSQCDDGSTGCQIDLAIDDAAISAEDPNKLVLEITIGDLMEELPVTIDVPLFGDTDCWMELNGGDTSTPAQIPADAVISFVVDSQSALNDMTVEIGDVIVDVDGVDYALSNRGSSGCGALGWAAEAFLDDYLRGMIADMIDEQVESMSDELLCRSCGEGDPSCPSSSTCETNDDDAPICMYNEDECVPMLLGIEGALEVGTLLGEYLPSGAADVAVTARMADRAEAEPGLSLGMRTGFYPETTTTCAPVSPLPESFYDDVPPSPTMNSNTKPNGDPFMFGFAMHRSTLQHLMWSMWASGGFCLQVGSENVDLLTTSAIGTLIEAVDVISTRQAPVQIRLAPQTRPDIHLGANQVNGDEVEEGLINLDWKDLDIHMYGFVQERFARLFTLRVDIDLPVAVVPDGDSGLLPVLGDVEAGITNLRIINNELVAADTETFEELIPMLLGLALPSLMDSLSDPIELPDLMGYQLILEDGDLTGIDNNEYLGLFASLEYVGTDTAPQAYRLMPRAVVSNHNVEVRHDRRILPEVSLQLDMTAEQGGAMLADNEVEYLYRLNEGGWRLGGSGPELTIKDATLMLQGEHALEVKARHLQEDARWQSIPTAMDIIVDYEAPELEAWQQQDAINITAEDVVDTTEQMTMRYRFVADGESGDWTSWSDVESIALEGLPTANDLIVDLEVRDREGHVAQTDITVRQAMLYAEGGDDVASGEEPSGCGGCAATGGAPTAPLGLLFIIIGLIAVRSRRRVKLIFSALAIVAITASGCSGCGDDTSSQSTCPDVCPNGEACVDGECAVPACDDVDCSELVCESGQVGVCDGDQCVCEEACAAGCDDGTFCCYESNSCQEYPNACQGVSCDDGYQREVTHLGDADSETCEVSGAECECVAKAPIDIRYHGSYPSVDSNGDVTAISVHNIGYGDLMIGLLASDKGTVVDWHFVDGVPFSGLVDGDPNGLRDGIISSGAEAGTHTATAVDDEGRIHTFYRHEDDESLKYARGEESGGEWIFETTVVEEEINTGFYSDVLLQDGILHLVYTARHDGESSELRYRAIDIETSLDDMSETEFEVINSGSTEAQDLEGHLPVAGLFMELIEHGDQLFLSFFDNTREQAGWMWGDGETWEAPTFLDEPASPYISARPDFEDEVHIAFMDETIPALIYRTESGAREEVISGIRDTANGWSEMPVGHDVQLRVSGAGTRLVYHDATTHELKRAVRDDDTGDWTVDTLAGVAGEPSAAHGLYASIFPLDGQLLVVDFSIDHSGEDNIGAPTFRWID